MYQPILLQLQFAFLPSVVGKVGIGMRSREEVEKNLALVGAEVKPVPLALWREARESGLLDQKNEGLGAALKALGPDAGA